MDVYIYVCVYTYIYVGNDTCGGHDGLVAGLTRPSCPRVNPLHTLHVESAERRINYGLLFILRPFYEYNNLEYAHNPV